jgi:hypothetical protein
MSADRNLTAAAARLRRAITEGRYADAQQCLAAYARAVAELQDPAAVSEAGGLIAWARKLMLARRAALRAQAASLAARPRGYITRRAQPAHTWEIEG